MKYIELQQQVMHQHREREMYMTVNQKNLRAACYQRLNRTNKSMLDLVSVENDLFHWLNAIYLSATKMDDYHNSARHFLLYIAACGNYKMDQSVYRDCILV